MVPCIAELSVKDLALVSELRLELAAGLTVLTGETGAGKSMLVDDLVLSREIAECAAVLAWRAKR